jgi:hypothetical protein
MVASFSCVVGKTVCECVMPKDEFEGLPVIDVPESEEITVAVKPDGLAEGDMDDPERHPLRLHCAAARASTTRVRRSEKC